MSTATTPIEGAADVRVVVLTGYGLNCEDETSFAFSRLGATVHRLHIGDMLDDPSRLGGANILAFIGGFSFGDHIASGRVLANRLRFRAGDALARFVDGGGLAIGMCNGFQTMVKMGLLPGLDRKPGALGTQTVSLVDNRRLGYWDRWVRLAVAPASPCVFTRGMTTIDVPSRHAEGQVVFRDDAHRARLEEMGCVPVRYVGADGQPTEQWPDNPNGSPGGIAGLCDPSGRIFGLMPHPEAFLYADNHPRRRPRMGGDAGEGSGQQLFRNGLEAVLGAER